MSSLTQKGVIGVTPEGRVMKKNRERQRANRRLKEQMLDLKDACGINDPTPREAVKEIINEFRMNRRKNTWNIQKC